VTRYLLDVNVLIALIDPAHVQHELAHTWFATRGSAAWATCPLTENGVLRIVGHHRYPGSPGTPADVATLLRALHALPGHQCWPDQISLMDKQFVQSDRLLTSAQVTDSYLLALAVSKQGQLATFDRRLVVDAVIGGAAALHLIG
jgi:toxin-antitoxin system PIN domain toxin